MCPCPVLMVSSSTLSLFRHCERETWSLKVPALKTTFYFRRGIVNGLTQSCQVGRCIVKINDPSVIGAIDPAHAHVLSVAIDFIFSLWFLLQMTY